MKNIQKNYEKYSEKQKKQKDIDEKNCEVI